MSNHADTGVVLRGLRLALGTLTMVPVGEVDTTDRRVGRWAMLLAPLAALPVGVAVGLVAWLGDLARLPHLAVGLLVVGTGAVTTRAMHLDGLADTVDGIGAGWDRERALTVMRTGDVGPMGVVALLVVLGVQAATAPLVHPVLLGVAWAAARFACTMLSVSDLPAARPEGLGATVAASVPAPAAFAALLVMEAVVATTAFLTGHGVVPGAMSFLALVLVVAWLARTARRVFGGVTGDVLGAGVEFGLTALLVVLTAGAWA